MKILVLGGSVFLSKAVAAEARRARPRGHLRDPRHLRAGARRRAVRGVGPDRRRCPTSSPDVVRRRGRRGPDPVVGAARRSPPSPDAHWVFVSTVNVYSDDSTPGGTPGHAPAARAAARGRRPEGRPGGVRPDEGRVRADRPRRRRLVDGDPARADRRAGRPDRPVHLLAGAAGRRRRGAGRRPSPRTQMQVIDVRDLAAWIVACAETRTAGDYDGVGEVLPIGDLLAAVRRGRRRRRRADLGAAGVPDRAGRRAVDGAGARCRCGCRARSTTGMAATTRRRRTPPAWCCARSPTPRATPSRGCGRRRTPVHRHAAASGRPRCSRPGIACLG